MTNTLNNALAALHTNLLANNAVGTVGCHGATYADVSVSSKDGSFCQFSVKLNLRDSKRGGKHVALNMQSLSYGVQGRVCKYTSNATVTAPSSLAKAVYAQVLECTRVREANRALNARRAAASK